MSSEHWQITVRGDCSPTSLDEFKASIFETFRTIDNFHSLSDTWGLDDFCGWEGTLENHNYVQGLTCWPVLKAMYDYAELGHYVEIKYEAYLGDPDWFFAGLVKRMKSLVGLHAYDGVEPSDALAKVILKYLARLKVDFYDRFANSDPEYFSSHTFLDGFVLIIGADSFWPDFCDGPEFGVVELALLAGLKSTKPVRNAQYAKVNPLLYTKKDGRIYIERESALDFLARARNYRPSNVDEFSPYRFGQSY